MGCLHLQPDLLCLNDILIHKSQIYIYSNFLSFYLVVETKTFFYENVCKRQVKRLILFFLSLSANTQRN